MLRRSLLPVAVLSFKLAAAQAQGLLLPAPLPGYRAVPLSLALPPLPGGAVVAPPAAAPIPTVRAAAYAPLAPVARQRGPVLPDNQLVYYRQNSPVATGASLAGAVASWLLGADPRVQAYQQYRQFTGRDNVLPVPRQVRPDDLLR
ncbi:MAG TPA: hypothetical protein VFO93_10705 [Hymenobacter sp.]|uniref:hypothetical protein n=1 Tax=Hymenobacter sp. TaxID=1898978 RepID=UPI002D80B52A|nr:hypothetical protein [Hymenobacter sp.]HET9504003.1 hypothetical protein [Hymenobacter sp.]